MDSISISKRFVAGTASGISLVLVGHPWDTIKVQMQVDKKLNLSLRSTIVNVFKTHGLKGFYYGMTAPLLTTGLINTLLWGSQFNLVEYMSKGRKAELSDTMKAAVISGILISLVVTPVEIIKSQMQVGKGDKGTIQVAREIIQRQNGFRGLFRGITAVSLVRANNWAYFGAYEFFQNAISKQSWAASSSRRTNAMLAGGLAGISFWFVAFPFDVIKARMMVDMTNSNKTFIGTAKLIYNEFGIKGFTKGFTPCVIRAFPANAAAFTGFEVTMSFLNQLF